MCVIHLSNSEQLALILSKLPIVAVIGYVRDSDMDYIREQPQHASSDDDTIDELIRQRDTLWEALDEIARAAGVEIKPGQLPDTDAIIRAVYRKFYGGF
jgi:hypothetical protein